ncbi:4-hydroxybenzoyl-CoA thioesterase [Falsochrobactrum shanghaiense]|uniref:4-hydroxybenzoyl-CoA thioesterase n=1 Tax=Falsochrobactrum shanghaiense TaxID=2201899 RepID=A0A316JCL0_9HYPH|nr:acyl-CoA thioesterase [Falsochrobactrum shanghaiense]PWL18469.1 4-hydroxybenzoyl-CoA thioesterase [Falsochrobactrum shanghaiense]
MSGLVTFVGVAHPWMCDVMGHMNVRHYTAMFDDASFQLLGHIAGFTPDTKLGWADIRSETEYRQEVAPGALITIHSRVVKIGRSSLAFEQIMTGSLDGTVRAVNQTVSVRFDLVARRSVRLDEKLRGRAEALFV